MGIPLSPLIAERGARSEEDQLSHLPSAGRLSPWPYPRRESFGSNAGVAPTHTVRYGLGDGGRSNSSSQERQTTRPFRHAEGCRNRRGALKRRKRGAAPSIAPGMASGLGHAKRSPATHRKPVSGPWDVLFPHRGSPSRVFQIWLRGSGLRQRLCWWVGVVFLCWAAASTRCSRHAQPHAPPDL